jgi:ABC-type antimicrobial peptide transport system permease subunit
MSSREGLWGADRGRAARFFAYTLGIAWDIVLMVFLNFFSDYIAYWQNGVRASLVDSDFSSWTPVATAALALSIAGYVIMIIIDAYPVRQFIRIAMHGVAIWAIASFIRIFPLDLSVIPNQDIADMLSWQIPLLLVLVILGLAVAITVRFVRLIIYLAAPKKAG